MEANVSSMLTFYLLLSSEMSYLQEKQWWLEK